MSGWTNWPAVHGETDIQQYEWFIQLWYAFRERCWIKDEPFFPKCSEPWDGYEKANSPTGFPFNGYVRSISGSRVTIDADRLWPAGRWYNWTEPPGPTGIPRHGVPAFYDLVIHDRTDRVEKMVRAEITASGADYVDIADISDYVTAGVISGVSELEGKEAYIIKRGGVWWAERWPAWPNDPEIATGTAAEGSPAGTIEISGQGVWEVDQFVGKQVMFRGTDGRLKRQGIVSNSSNALNLADGTITAAGGLFAIVEPGARWAWGRPKEDILCWYRGKTRPYWTRPLNDPVEESEEWVAQTDIPVAPEYRVESPLCFAVSPDIDTDAWVERFNKCYEGPQTESPVAPDLFKTLRTLQAKGEELSKSFIERRDYSGAPYMHPYTQAEYFKTITGEFRETETTGMNYDPQTGLGDGTLYVKPFTFPFEATAEEPLTVYYTIYTSTRALTHKDATENPQEQRSERLASGKEVLEEKTVTYTSGTSADHLGPGHVWLDHDDLQGHTAGVAGNFVSRKVLISFGYRRWLGRKVNYVYPQMFFVPESNLAAAPTETDPGAWWQRPASSRYLDWGDNGLKSDSARPKVGERARYWGDNQNDPPYQLPADILLDEGVKHQLKRTFNQRDPSLLSGTATDESVNGWYLTDGSKGWYRHGKHAITHQGMAGAGSAGSLTTSTPDAFWAGTRLVGLVLKLANGRQVPITGQDGATVTFPPHMDVTVTSGLQFSIDEPKYEANTFMQRRVEVVDPTSGMKHRRNITHNSDTTLFFDEALPFDPAPGTEYRILELQPGDVVTWDGTKWVTDPSSTFIAANSEVVPFRL